MHVLLLTFALLGMVIIRQGLYRTLADIQEQPLVQLWVWREYWYRALAAIVLPPLGLICAIVAIMMMGHHGAMFGMSVGAWGCWLSWGLIGTAVLLLMALLWRIYTIQQELKYYPRRPLAVASPYVPASTTRQDFRHGQRWDLHTDRSINHHPNRHHQRQPDRPTSSKTQPLYGRVLSEPSWFAGYVGLWQPELAIGQALRTQLSAEQLAVVIAHESGHAHYRDTLLFFVLGWLRRLTAWLPHTRSLWQILVLLREIRADRWASQFVDPLVLAETLVFVVRQTMQQPAESLQEPHLDWIGFHDQVTWASFQQRLNCLLLSAELGVESVTESGTDLDAHLGTKSGATVRSARSARSSTPRNQPQTQRHPNQHPQFMPSNMVQQSWKTFAWIAVMLILALLPLAWIPFHHYHH